MNRFEKILDAVGKLTIPLVGGFALVRSSMYDVDGGERVVIFDRFRGVLPGVIEEGTHFLVPWLQRAIHFDVRIKPSNITTMTGSKGN